MDTNKKQWKRRNKRRRERNKRVICAISVTGMLSLSIFLIIYQGGNNRFGAKAANFHKSDISREEDEHYQKSDDTDTTTQNQETPGLQDNEDNDAKGFDDKETKEDFENNINNSNMDESNNSNNEEQFNENKENSLGEDPSKEDTLNDPSKEESLKDPSRADTSKNDTLKEDPSKEDISKEDLSKEENNEIEDDFFKDSIFIGDSRTEGLGQFGGVKNAKFYTHQGLMVNTAIGKDYIILDNNQKGNVLDAARQESFSKVYLMFGLNELGWNSLDIFIEDYRDIIEGLREIEPNCEIIIQGNYPVTKKISERDKVYNNTNIKKFNGLIKEMAKEEGVTYIDLYSYFADEKGNLPDKAASDGIHLNPSYFKDWKQCLIDFGSGNTER